MPNFLDKIRKIISPAYCTGFGTMDYNKARKILKTSSKSKIAERYYALAKINHPDNGGSEYITSKLNEAKMYLDEYFKPL